jgi:hypothetical protein
MEMFFADVDKGIRLTAQVWWLAPLIDLQSKLVQQLAKLIRQQTGRDLIRLPEEA